MDDRQSGQTQSYRLPSVYFWGTHTVVGNQTRLGFPHGSVGEESACSAGDAGDPGSIPKRERSPGGGNGNPLQCSGLENPMDAGAWRATVHGVAKSRTGLSNLARGETVEPHARWVRRKHQLIS